MQPNEGPLIQELLSSIDRGELSIICTGAFLTFIVSLASAWLLDRHQTTREREWHRKREQALLRRQKLEEQQRVVGRLIHDLQVGFRTNPLMSRLLDTRLKQERLSDKTFDAETFRETIARLRKLQGKVLSELHTDLKSRMINVAHSMSAFSSVDLPDDPQLHQLLEEWIETQKELAVELDEILKDLEDVDRKAQGAQLLDNPEELSEEELWDHVEYLRSILSAQEAAHRRKEEFDRRAADLLAELGRQIDRRFEQLKVGTLGE